MSERTIEGMRSALIRERAQVDAWFLACIIERPLLTYRQDWLTRSRELKAIVDNLDAAIAALTLLTGAKP